MKNTKSNKGITLIALIITIIILLILAIVTINAIQGDEGLITKANNAAYKYKKEAENENSIIDKYNKFMDEKIAEINSDTIYINDAVYTCQMNQVNAFLAFKDGYMIALGGIAEIYEIPQSEGKSITIEDFAKLTFSEDKRSIQMEADEVYTFTLNENYTYADIYEIYTNSQEE